ncbi:MAG: hypothetical protein NZM00_03165, partial [Anaerolinea sp.]|nr:hypothetical protein [Anaerolinea sp.]
RADGMRLHSTAGRYNLLIPVDSRTVGMVLENTDTGVMTTILPLTTPALALGYGLNHDGTRVMAAYRTVNSPAVLRIWDTASGAQMHELALESQRGTAVAFGNLIAIDQGEGIRLLSFDDGSLSEPIALEGTLLPSTGGLVTEQQIGDVNRLTALIADDTGRRVLTVDMPACRTLRTLSFILDDVLVVVRGGAGGTVSRYALESGALMSAAGGFGLFDVATGAVVRSVDRMSLPVIFSPDGKHLIGADGVILISVEV